MAARLRLAALGAAALGLAAGAPVSDSADSDWQVRAERMVREQIEARGVRDPRVLAALRAVPRHRFVPEAWRERRLRRRAATRSATGRPSPSPTSWRS